MTRPLVDGHAAALDAVDILSGKKERPPSNLGSVLDMAKDDAGSFQRANATDEDKARVSELTYRLVLLQDEVEDLEEQLKAKKRELRNVEENELPEAMDRVGLSEFKTKNGTKVSVKTFYNASIPAARKDEAMQWLEDNDHGGIIKTEVSVRFAKGEYEFVESFMRHARGFNGLTVEPEMSRGVHAQTLKAFVREVVESGAALPLDTFGVFIGRKATVKVTKTTPTGDE